MWKADYCPPLPTSRHYEIAMFRRHGAPPPLVSAGFSTRYCISSSLLPFTAPHHHYYLDHPRPRLCPRDIPLPMSKTDRQPLLPQHVNHTPHKLSASRISFPPSSASAPRPDGPDAGESSAFVSVGRRRAFGPAERGGERQGLPKLSRECLWA